MAVSITKKFWNSTDLQYDDISKVVFTSPNMDSPATAGKRSHILPGSQYIATWYEAVDYMHLVNSNQEASSYTYYTDATTFSGFDFTTDTQLYINTPTTSITNGKYLYSDVDNYAEVSSSSVSTMTSGISFDILAPTASAAWTYDSGQSEYIWWNSEGLAVDENVNIYITYDNGSNWSSPIASTNDGTELVLPTSTTASGEAQVKIVYEDITAYSDNFTITSYVPGSDEVPEIVEVPAVPEDPDYIYTPPYTTTSGASSAKDSHLFYSDNYIYRIDIDTFCDVYRYDLSTGSDWESVGWSNSPDTITSASHFIIIGDKVYIIRGTDNSFWEYDITTDNWVSLEDTLFSGHPYCYMDTCGESDVIYAMPNNVTTATNSLYKYTISTDSWIIAYTFDTLYSTTYRGNGPFFWKDGTDYYSQVVYISSTSLRVYLIKMNTNTNMSSDTSPPLYVLNYSTYDNLCQAAIFGAKKDDGVFVNIYLSADAYGTTPNVHRRYFFAAFDTNSNAIIHDTWYGIDTSYGTISLTGLSYTHPHTILSSSTSGTDYYIYPKSDANTYLYRYTTGLSSTDSYGYLSGADTFFESESIPSSMAYFDNKLYITSASKSTAIWVDNLTTSTGSWSVMLDLPYKDTTYTDNSYFTNGYKSLISGSNNLFYFEGFDSYGFSTSSGTTWTTKSGLPWPSKKYVGMSYHQSSNVYYAIQGEASRAFWSYDITGDTWTQLEDTPDGLDPRCSIKVVGDYAYVLKGNVDPVFWRFDINTPANGWSVLSNFPGTIGDLAWGLTSSGTTLRAVSKYDSTYSWVYPYNTVSGTWSLNDTVAIEATTIDSVTGDGQYLYAATDMDAISYNNNDSIYVHKVDLSSGVSVPSVSGVAGIPAVPDNYDPYSSTPPSWYEAPAITSGTLTSVTNLSLTNVSGTSTLSAGDNVYTFTDTNDVDVDTLNTVIFEVTNGEAYNCRLTAWDDETHTTTSNKILSESHYKAFCFAYSAASGTKDAPETGLGTMPTTMRHAPGIDVVLKGNTSYYGDFDLIHVANGGPTGTAHGDYLIFQPRLDAMDDTFTSGNYDFITTLHYQYT